ncbi:DNA-binding protein WhiA [Mycoplasma bovis]|uniref:DNA-binding protein WhiA n=1 Tax=Mycoplasmopsis bovis TaxID=28903 RepID=UPI001938C5C8|nr:DNA-binding protein WhiA [Mycoplasmopsis bovis]MBT1315945.1 DNA-binding protein WhiA [Mycoplasmopsis bovis]MBT1326627.1 DNA-binding protein WhiA [Mycoplasmopsis bovis]MBT1345432.1 DNA-binding protein WhiA [Mycoplasmopsis bovis]MBT1367461.1 DNA-binding protein WhiA [Mycoplasmopsis bovis]MBT1369634.1 DNA-binding protein WhiA [Mycoplasmopsis bovis]
MNFTKEIKLEILSKKRNIDDASEFLRGYIYSKCIIDNDIIKLRIYDKSTKSTVLKSLNKIGIKYENKNTVILINKDNFSLIEDFSYPSSFFQGVFAGNGSISNLNNSSYHLQLASNYEEFIDIIINKLNEYDFNFVKIKHNNKFIAYIKKHEKISDFLKAISVTSSFFNFMDNTISRDFLNNTNRLRNIDASNINKIVTASNKYIKNIDLMYELELENKFNEDQLKLFQIMKENPNESLSSIADLYAYKENKSISKSGIYHWLKKLEKTVMKK